MQSIRNGTLEQLHEFRHQLKIQIRERKIATCSSYGKAFLIAATGFSLLCLISNPTLNELTFGHIAFQIVTAIFGYMLEAPRFRNAAKVERVMTALVDAAIQEKQFCKTQGSLNKADGT